ncbi:DUF805 domain-containing protein [Youhaiella tibetensis]|uniref:DUF805 domain-containing protein n=1 Tax=Paradevosia tibetensis TaxID=1447062 RepID=A0A5B9DIT2_9HYPH|nr:DUF805 domain-containing protein [Youhaiella tibetensis]QEE18966.1 DUF805 domain-containing protein [Youhaiella tibetensis]GGF37544.1 DUF805 domain-containing protein [Youhaiella tibetensis]
MDNLVPLYTTFNGRISRKTYWLGVVGIIVAAIVLGIILGVVGLGLANPGTAAWGSLILFVLLAVPSLALGVKRRHDRNGSGNDVYVYFALSFILVVVQALGFGFTMTEVEGVSVPMPTMTMTIFNAVLGIFALYLLVVLGFLKGTEGENQYGPDPLSA